MHPFMRADLLIGLAAIGLYPLLLFVPGYVIGWASGLFDFRQRTPAFRVAFSIPLSIAACPILIYLAGRFASMAAVWAVLAVTWIGFVVLLVRHGLSWPRFPRRAWWIVLAWLAIALFISVDLQFGATEYYPVSAFDYALRSEVIHSIGTTGIPPHSPFFFPGHAVPLRYHYFWLLFPALIYQGTGYAITPRLAWIGGVFWCGLGLMCLVAVAFRVLWNRGPASFPRRAIAGILLLTVTGLDIIPTAFLWLLRASGMMLAIRPSVEWWNEQVDGFVYTALWEAHHLSGLIACMMAFLLLREGQRQESLVRRATYAGVAGMAVATAVGASIHVAFVFVSFLVIWTIIVLAKRWWREAAVLAMAGAVAILLASPYALALAGGAGGHGGHGGAAAGGGPPLYFAVRQFNPANFPLQAFGLTGSWIAALVHTGMLPLNYFMELGFFFTAAVVWWRRWRSTGKPLSRDELALAVLVATSIGICTYLHSSVIGNNDLGSRGFLPAQFGLLLWSVDVLFEQPRTRGITILLALGVLGTAYDVAILRVHPILEVTGVLGNVNWIAPDRHMGARTYSAREAYQWIAQSTAPDAHIQFDPHVWIQDTPAMLYSRRPIVAADFTCLAVFGGDPSLCPPLLAQLAPLYPDKGRPAAASIETACQNLPVDILVAKDLDAAWADPQGWVWKEKPAFSNPYYRVFRCRDAVGKSRVP
ncbi:MAG TPA: hypothetical protein VGE89_01425 [Bryobacteraceae bacterium]